MTPEQGDAIVELIRQATIVLKRTVDELARTAESVVMANLSNPIPMKVEREVKPEKHLLSSKELATKLGVSTVSIYRLRKEGMPDYRIGGRILFDLDLVMGWIDQHNRGAGRHSVHPQ